MLRDMRWQDIEALTVIDLKVFPDTAWSAATWWGELAGRPRRDYVVDVDDARILAYGGLDHAGVVCDVMTLAVTPCGRGRGLGRVVLDELLARARARHTAYAWLEVRADNRAALGLYERAGFEVLRTRRGYYPGGVDALVMRLDLGATHD